MLRKSYRGATRKLALQDKHVDAMRERTHIRIFVTKNCNGELSPFQSS